MPHAVLYITFLLCCMEFSRSCKHMLEHRFGQNHFIDNHYLRDALRRYESIHSDCYAKGFKEDLLSNPGKGNADCRYLIVNWDASGFGNRMMVTLTFFLLALLTDRVLILHTLDYPIDKIMCSPFVNSDWQLPKSINLNDMLKSFYGMENVEKKIYVWRNDAGVTFPQHQFYETLHWFNYTDNRHNVVLAHIWYIRDSEQYGIPMLFANPTYTNTLMKWFPDKKVATVLLRYLLHPQDEIWDSILSNWIITHHISSYTIGLHARFGHDEFDDNSHCLYTHQYNEPVVMYIASLTPLQHHFQLKYPNWTIIQQQNEHKELHTYTQMKSVLYDIFTLSMTDEIILSASSTMSYLIQALHGESCTYMHNKSSCIHSISSEPCCHVCKIYHWIPFEYVNSRPDIFTNCADSDNNMNGLKLTS